MRRNTDKRSDRKGTVLIVAVVMMFGLFSFLAFGIDIGYVAQTKAEMQRTADAAALAGCWEFHSQLLDGNEGECVYPDVRQVAASYAAANTVNERAPVLQSSAGTQDIEVGYLDALGGSITSDDTRPFFAVRTTVTKNEYKNGQVPYFFGRIFGSSGQDVQVEATAVMSRFIQGFQLPAGSSSTIELLPFALDENTWEDLKSSNTADDYSFDPNTGTISSGSDGLWEANLYPQGTGSPGNRGTVDIGGANNSTTDIKRQIVDGISEQDLIDLGKPLILSSGGTMTLNGDTGISAGVKSQLSSIIGETRVIPIFSSVTGNGNNATYTIVKWVGVRLLYVKLTGSMKSKRVIIQPAPIISPFSVTSTQGSSTSDFVLGTVVLAR